ncbi:RuvB-like helicase 1 [Venturia nashicola]|uniref:RuvB-like helicase 1 n=1 Tax=Venturia nashicola TaxID=86259 RepID=A0A4Z1P0R4_9PEZI|nr:RuvB-like helicase 1 [Venturia nashicola]
MDTPKKVHYITLSSFLFGLAFCLSHGIVTHELAPALGLIPLGIGALLALYRITRFPPSTKTRKGGYTILSFVEEDGEEEEGRNNKSHAVTWQTILLALLDFGCFGGLIITVVFSIIANNAVRCRYTNWTSTWEGVQRHHRFATCTSTQPILAAWATMVMLVNAVIHLYLLVTFLLKLWYDSKDQTKTPLCTRCKAPMCDKKQKDQRPAHIYEEYDEHADQASSSAA